jgi:hypothetical protein
MQELRFITQASIEDTDACQVVKITYCYHGNLVTYRYEHDRQNNFYSWYIDDPITKNDQHEYVHDLFAIKKTQAQLFLQRTQQPKHHDDATRK